MKQSTIVRLSPVTIAMIRLRAMVEGRSLKETTERLLSLGLEYEKRKGNNENNRYR